MSCVLNFGIRPGSVVLLLGVLLPAAPIWAQACARRTGFHPRRFHWSLQQVRVDRVHHLQRPVTLRGAGLSPVACFAPMLSVPESRAQIHKTVTSVCNDMKRS